MKCPICTNSLDISEWFPMLVQYDARCKHCKLHLTLDKYYQILDFELTYGHFKARQKYPSNCFVFKNKTTVLELSPFYLSNLHTIVSILDKLYKLLAFS